MEIEDCTVMLIAIKKKTLKKRKIYLTGIARCKTSSNNKTDQQQVDSFFKFHRDLKLGRGAHLAGLHDIGSYKARPKILAMESAI